MLLPTTLNVPLSFPNVAFSEVHFMLVPSRPGGLMEYALTNSTGGEPSTLSVPASSQHSGWCAISVRPCASSGSPSARQKVPWQVPTPGSNRNVCIMRRSSFAHHGPPGRLGVRYAHYVDGTDLGGKQLPQLTLPDRLCADRRGPRHRPAGLAALSRGRTPKRLGDHAGPEYPRASGSYGRQRRNGGRHGRPGPGPCGRREP